MVNFYHRFVPAAAQLMWPLVATFLGRAQRLKQCTLLSWTEDMLQNFNATKQVLADATMLAHPQHDAPIALSMDTSNTAVACGATNICHGEDGKPMVSSATTPLGLHI